MTPTYSHFMSYEPCVLDKIVQTADGTLLQVIGIGSIKFRTHRSSHSSITCSQNIYQLGLLGWRIGFSRICHGLYHLLVALVTLRQKENFMVAAVTSIPAKEATLIHRRLGHPSFTLLKMIYPSLFKNCSINDLVCDACQLAKLKRNTYLLEQN